MYNIYNFTRKSIPVQLRLHNYDNDGEVFRINSCKILYTPKDKT